MPNKSKIKGKSGERELSKILSKIFDEKFGRVFGSGQFVGGKNIKRIEKINEIQYLSSRGDIISPEKYKNFIFECKWYDSFPWHKFLLNEKIPILENNNGWINQIKLISENQKWFLCMKFNYQGWFVLIDKENHELSDDFFKDLSFIKWFSINHNKYYYIFELLTFFKKYKNIL